MASAERLESPGSSVSSLLASSGRLQSSLHPEPIRSIRYRDKHYSSASDALDAYISDYQRSLRTGTLELAKPHPRNRDVLKTSLTDGELNFLNIPTRKRDSDRLSMTTDDLLALPNDGSLPVTRTSALLSRSGSFPSGLSSRSHLRPAVIPKRSICRPASKKTLHVDDLLMDRLRSHHQAPPPTVLPTNQTLPLNTPRLQNLPRWMSSHRSDMDFSGLSSVPDLRYPLWLRECEESSAGQPPPPHRVPSWLGELEESSAAPAGQQEVRGHSEEPQSISLRDLRLQANTQQLFKDDKIGSLILRAEQMLNSPSFAVKEHNSSADTEDALDADRSWDNPTVTFKSPVQVGAAEEPPTAEELQRSKSAASSGYSSRSHPGPVEALKHMLFRLQAVEHKISQSQQTTADSGQTSEKRDTEVVDGGSGESLQRALHHLDKLKTLVDDMNERKARAGNDGIDRTAVNTTD